jgi:hypothetical protein
MNKTLYVIQYWVPFPSSEYSGLYVVVADNDEECIALLRPDNYYPEYNDLIPSAVKNAVRFHTQHPVSEIVDSLTT